MKGLLKKLKGKRNIILFLDYDGTIVPIREKPELAKLHPLRRKLLEEISEKITVSVISGRRVSDLKELVKLKKISLIGNHGLEILYRGQLWIHPEALKIKKVLRKTLKKIEKRAKNFNGVIIEDKGLSGSIHFRLLKAGSKEILQKIVEEEVGDNNRRLKIREGKKVYEIIPNIDWDKGKSVKNLIALLKLKGQFLKIYIGDDETDEDAFRIFGEKDITILVGRKKRSLAKFRLKNVDEVWKFLKEINKNILNTNHKKLLNS